MRFHRLSSTLLLTLLNLIPAPGSHGATDAASIVDCWAGSLGGREKLATIVAVERSGSMETGGMKGTVRSWSTATGAVRTDVELGPYRSTDAFDGSRGWTKSGSAPAHELTNADLARIVSDGYMESMSMFFDGRMKGAITAGESDGMPLLVVAPERGRPMSVRLGKESCLPFSIEQPERDRTMRVDLMEWTEVDGVRFAKKLRQSTGDPAYDIVVTWESIRINPTLTADLFREGPGEGTGIGWNGRASVVAPLELTQNHPYVPVMVNGKGPSMFVLDTGADMTVIDKAHAAAIGLAMEGSLEIRGGGEGTLDAAMIAAPTVGIAGLDIPSEALIAIPLGPLSLYEGRPIDGILGYDVLSRFVVEVDYDAKRVTFHDPTTFTAPKGASALDISFDGNTPVMKGTLALPGGRSFDARLTLDTGNRTALILHAPFVAAHDIRASLPVLANAPLGMGVGGMTRQDVGRIASLTLGGFVMKSPLTSFSVEKSGANANPELDGNVGSEVLRRFTLWIDYGRKRILLRPNERLSEPFEHDMSGLTLALRDWSTKEPAVINVLPGSPAAGAGLAAGDLLVAIDGRKTASMSLEAARALLVQPGKRIRVEVLRGETRLSITIKLRRLV